MVSPVLRMTHPGHTEHFIILAAVPSRQIAIGDNVLRGQRCTNIFGIGKCKESFPVFLVNIEAAVLGDPVMIRKMNPLRSLVRIIRVNPIADSVIGVNIHMIDAAVIRRHRRDHIVQILLMLFLRQNLLRDVGNEDHIDAAVCFRFRKMAVVIHPAHFTVLPDNAVYGIIHPVLAGVDLLGNRILDFQVIIRVHHSPKCISRE